MITLLLEEKRLTSTYSYNILNIKPQLFWEIQYEISIKYQDLIFLIFNVYYFAVREK